MYEPFRDLEVADTFHKRFWGLMGKHVEPGYALAFPRCRAIHCLFMREAIDVVFLDAACRVLTVRRVKPWHMAIGPAGTAHVLELAAGEAENLRIRVGTSLAGQTGFGSFERAIEDASCWLGLNCGSSCISGAYSSKTHWWFASTTSYLHPTTFVIVSKRTGKIVLTTNAIPAEGLEEVEVPWQYVPGGKRRCA